MTGYILSILGIVVAGVIIDIIIPTGSISKYIKSIYSIFVVAVIMTPIINLANTGKDIKLEYNDYEISANLMNFIFNSRVDSIEKSIIKELKDEGINNVDININFSIENNELVYNSCEINLKNLVIDEDKQHINKYEFITKIVNAYTALSSEEIIIYE